jgi:hypothetical protein
MPSVICVILPCLCNEVWDNNINHQKIAQNSADTPQTSLDKHNIPQTSLYKHGTKTKNTLDIPQASLHKHGIAQISSDIPETCMSEVICAVPCLCNKAWGMSGVICVFFPVFM